MKYIMYTWQFFRQSQEICLLTNSLVIFEKSNKSSTQFPFLLKFYNVFPRGYFKYYPLEVLWIVSSISAQDYYWSWVVFILSRTIWILSVVSWIISRPPRILCSSLHQHSGVCHLSLLPPNSKTHAQSISSTVWIVLSVWPSFWRW